MEISAQLDSVSTDLNDLTEFFNTTKNVWEWKRCESVILKNKVFIIKKLAKG